MSNNEINDNLVERLCNADIDLCREAAERIERLTKHRRITRREMKKQDRLLETSEAQIQKMANALRRIVALPPDRQHEAQLIALQTLELRNVQQ